MGHAWTPGEQKVRAEAPAGKNRRSKPIGKLEKSPNRDDHRFTRTEQARRIARHWVTHIERLQSSHVSLKSLGLDLTRTRPNRKRRYKELKAEELYSELGRTFLIGLIDMRRSSDFYNAHPKGERTEQVVRESAVFMLLQIIKLVWPTNQYLDLGLNVEPLLRLQRAISEVVNGSNDRLLVTGEFADRLVQRDSQEIRGATSKHARPVQWNFCSDMDTRNRRSPPRLWLRSLSKVEVSVLQAAVSRAFRQTQ